MRKNKLLIIVLGVAILVGFVFSLGLAAQPRIRVLFLTAPDALNLRDMIPQFEKSFGIKVNWEDTAYADIHTKEISDFVAHSGRYDVIMMDNPWLGFPVGKKTDTYLEKGNYWVALRSSGSTIFNWFASCGNVLGTSSYTRFRDVSLKNSLWNNILNFDLTFQIMGTREDE